MQGLEPGVLDLLDMLERFVGRLPRCFGVNMLHIPVGRHLDCEEGGLFLLVRLVVYGKPVAAVSVAAGRTPGQRNHRHFPLRWSLKAGATEFAHGQPGIIHAALNHPLGGNSRRHSMRDDHVGHGLHCSHVGRRVDNRLLLVKVPDAVVEHQFAAVLVHYAVGQPPHVVPGAGVSVLLMRTVGLDFGACFGKLHIVVPSPGVELRRAPLRQLDPGLIGHRLVYEADNRFIEEDGEGIDDALVAAVNSLVYGELAHVELGRLNVGGQGIHQAAGKDNPINAGPDHEGVWGHA